MTAAPLPLRLPLICSPQSNSDALRDNGRPFAGAPGAGGVKGGAQLALPKRRLLLLLWVCMSGRYLRAAAARCESLPASGVVAARAGAATSSAAAAAYAAASDAIVAAAAAAVPRLVKQTAESLY